MAENMTENNNFLLRSAIISSLRPFLAFIDVAPSHSPSFSQKLKREIIPQMGSRSSQLR